MFLDNAVLPATPTAPLAVAAKVALDQLLQTPFGYALFFSFMKAAEGRPQDAVREVRAKLVPTLIANWYLWPAAQLLNFTLVPLNLRILYCNVISIGWTAYVSTVASQGAGGQGVKSQGAGGEAARYAREAEAEAAREAAAARGQGRTAMTAGARR